MDNRKYIEVEKKFNCDLIKMAMIRKQKLEYNNEEIKLSLLEDKDKRNERICSLLEEAVIRNK